MNRQRSLGEGKPVSLVFQFTEQLPNEGGMDSPEPDFLKWLDKALFADVGTAADEAAWTKLPIEEHEGWNLFLASLEATGKLIDFYKSNPTVFQKIASQLSFLPCLMSWHPDSGRFSRQLLEFSKLGQQSMYGDLQKNPRHMLRQCWPVQYAYAIIATINLTLDTYEDRLPLWAEIYGYGVKYPIPLSDYMQTMERLGWDEAKKRRELPKYKNSYRVLPLWTKSLKTLRRPFNTDHVLDYWRTGKQMIVEELPNFHLRPEWEGYRGRTYKAGAKPGAIQHAIFKDILVALKTIAGSTKQKNERTATRPAIGNR
jgi:hypothetical protein